MRRNARVGIESSPVPMEGSGQIRGSGRDRLLWIGMALVLLFVGAAVLAPRLAPHDPLQQFASGLTETGAPRPPGGPYPLGTDDYGRDVLSRLLFGARLSLFIGVSATAIAIGVGTLLGLAAGYSGGAAETVIMRLTDVVMAFPALLLAIAF